MKIYIDILMLTNAVTAMILVRCTARLSRERLRLRRELMAGLVGAAASLLVLVRTEGVFPSVIVLAAKIAAAMLMTFIAFRPDSIRGLLRRTALYLICELGFGGACLALVGITGRKGLCIRSCTVYFDVTIPQLAVCCGAVYGIIALADRIQRHRRETVGRFRAVFRLGSFVREFTAYSDTGNTLRDSFTGAPVMIFRSDELYERFELDRPEKLFFNGFRPVPYETISGSGLISVTPHADITINADGTRRRAECCAGIVPSNGGREYAVFAPAVLDE